MLHSLRARGRGGSVSPSFPALVLQRWKLRRFDIIVRKSTGADAA